MAISFSNMRARELLLAAARRCGFDKCNIHCGKDLQSNGSVSWEVMLAIEGVWTQSRFKKSGSLVFVRYRFFDLGKSTPGKLYLCLSILHTYMCDIEPVSSRPVAISHSSVGKGDCNVPLDYHSLKHQACINLPVSDRLQW